MSFNRGHGLHLIPKNENSTKASWITHKAWRIAFFLSIVVAVVSARFLVWGLRAAHFHSISRETGSVAEFCGQVSPNHAGTALVYQQSVENGVGVFFAQIPGGNGKLLYELPEKYATKNRGALNLNVWGWAADDSLFAFSRLNGPSRELIICNGKSGAPERDAKVNRQIKDLVWLGSDALAFVNDENNLYFWRAGNESRGSRVSSFVRKGRTKPDISVRSLVALGNDTVAWQDGSAIWSWRYGAESPRRIWQGENRDIVDMGLSPDGQMFLLRLKDRNMETVAGVPVDGGEKEELAQFKALEGQTIKNQIVWWGEGFARAWGGVWQHSVFVYPHYGDKPQELWFPGGIISYSASGNSLYLAGSRSGEPLGVWRYTVGQVEPTCVLSNSFPRYQVALPVAPEKKEFLAKNGTTITYWLWTPPGIEPGSKHPLLLGGSCWGWDSYRSAVVNGGAYVVNIDQDDWYSDWTVGVPELMQYLRDSLPLDDARCYLFGTSAQVQYASHLLVEYPEIFRGELMFSPGGMGPSLKGLQGHGLFMDCGADDGITAGVLKYRDSAFRNGVAVTTIVHQDAEHTYRSIRSVRSRDEAVMKFVFEY